MNIIKAITGALFVLCCAVRATGQPEHSHLSGCNFLLDDTASARQYLTGLFDSLSFSPNEHIADVGAKGGNLAGVLSLFYNNIDITLEDIDSSCLNKIVVDSMFQYYDRISGGKRNNISCHLAIGNEVNTLLPEHAYQKVFLLNTYHEFSRPAQMLRNIHHILAPDGILYVQEAVSTYHYMVRPDCRHMTTLQRDLLSAFRYAGFELDQVKVLRRIEMRRDVVCVNLYRFRKAEH